MRPRPPDPGVHEGTAAAICALVCLSRECERLAVELRLDGIRPRTRLACGAVMTSMLRAAPLIEAIEETGRPTLAERTRVEKVKAAMRSDPPKAQHERRSGVVGGGGGRAA